MSRRTLRWQALLGALALFGAACTGSGGEGDPTATPTPAQLNAQVASYDLSSDRPQRVIVGLPANDGRVLSYGTVEFAFGYLGRTAAEGEPRPGPEAEAAFLPVPGEEGPAGPRATPELTPASEARGVYAAHGVEFDEAGLWQVTVTAEVEGEGTLTASTAFPVLEAPRVPAVGEPAPKTENHLPDAEGVPLAAIDSAAEAAGRLPDPHLHETTIAAAIEAGRPALVIFSTPVYCTSQFCGPVTDVIADLALEHEGEAEFIHVEVWRDYQGQVINKAAAEWILVGEEPDQQLQEPWLFLIGPDGRIAARWDNLFDVAEVEAELAAVAG